MGERGGEEMGGMEWWRFLIYNNFGVDHTNQSFS
jgi:hypothetical protein